jgi:hypothetical protein
MSAPKPVISERNNEPDQVNQVKRHVGRSSRETVGASLWEANRERIMMY